MGRIGKLLSFVREVRNGANVSDAKVDRGGSDIRTLEHFSAPGDDSHPLPGDYVAALPQAGTGRDSAVGYLDPLNTPVAQAGEKRIYSRDLEGSPAAEVHLKSNSDIETTSPFTSTSGNLKVGTGASGTFTSGEGLVITVQDGIVIGIV